MPKLAWAAGGFLFVLLQKHPTLKPTELPAATKISASWSSQPSPGCRSSQLDGLKEDKSHEGFGASGFWCVLIELSTRH